MRSTQAMDARTRRGWKGGKPWAGELAKGMDSAEEIERKVAEMDAKRVANPGHTVADGLARIKDALHAMMTMHGGLPQFGWSFVDGYLALTIMPPASVGGRGDVVAWTDLDDVALSWQSMLLVQRVPECRGWSDYSCLQELLTKRARAQRRRDDHALATLRVDELRCVTVHQVWAWAFFGAGKDVENRNFRPGYTGLLGIHCGRNDNVVQYNDACAFIKGMTGITPPSYHECMAKKGKILGTVEIVGCEARPDSVWYMGTSRWGWKLRNPRLFAHGYPMRGQLGLWSWEPPGGRLVYAEPEKMQCNCEAVSESLGAVCCDGCGGLE